MATDCHVQWLTFRPATRRSFRLQQQEFAILVTVPRRRNTYVVTGWMIHLKAWCGFAVSMDVRLVLLMAIFCVCTWVCALCSDSCQLGWRLLTLVTSYCRCSEALGPYLTTFLEQTANDERRANYSQYSAWHYTVRSVSELRENAVVGGPYIMAYIRLFMIKLATVRSIEIVVVAVSNDRRIHCCITTLRVGHSGSYASVRLL